jgi:hypothetical protein
MPAALPVYGRVHVMLNVSKNNMTAKKPDLLLQLHFINNVRYVINLDVLNCQAIMALIALGLWLMDGACKIHTCMT